MAIHSESLDIAFVLAQDMGKEGCSLAELLRAGQWRSAAFMAYLDSEAVNQVTVTYRTGCACNFRASVMLVRCNIAFAVAINQDEEWID